jgi:hypothetical protein
MKQQPTIITQLAISCCPPPHTAAAAAAALQLDEWSQQGTPAKAVKKISAAVKMLILQSSALDHLWCFCLDVSVFFTNHSVVPGAIFFKQKLAAASAGGRTLCVLLERFHHPSASDSC